MENTTTSLEGYTAIQAGLREKTTITEIRIRKAEEVYGAKYWENIKTNKDESPEDFAARLASMRKQDVAEIHTANGATTAISLPSSRQYNPKSKLASFVKIYGSLPKIGLDVMTEYDQNGFRRIVV